MAKYVVIEFDNDEDADAYINEIKDAEESIMGMLSSHYGAPQLARIVGLYKKPTIFCECQGSRKPPMGWTRGKKYGWWICTECGKPSQQWSRALPSMMGVNLLHHKELNNDQSNSTV